MPAWRASAPGPAKRERVKKDGEIHMYFQARRKGARQAVAAAKAGISERTARKYERAGIMPSQSGSPRTYRTRKDPFAEDWPWVVEQLEKDDALQAQTLFDELQRVRPGIYPPGQLRTLQRRVHAWRVTQGPDREVIFEQVHPPARMAQSDFTSMNALKITIAGEPFPHLLFHSILTHSRFEAVRLCFSESFEAFSEGIEYAFMWFGGAPSEHRTDNLSAAVRTLDRHDPHRFTERYAAMLAHYDVRASTNTAGVSHENGAVEQSHHRFKDAVDQGLRLRGTRDFPNRQGYEAFLHALLSRRNASRHKRFEAERLLLRPLPAKRLDHSRTIDARVTCFSVVRVLGNRYSVPSRLIGENLKARIHTESIDLSHHGKHVLSVPRIPGKTQHVIDYRHVAASLARKPGAFANYRFREELFPSTVFRRAYDVLKERLPASADTNYVRILHRAASVSEADVQTALDLLLERERTPTFDEVKTLTDAATAPSLPMLPKPVVDLSRYDCLLLGAAS
jgi:transposase